MRLRRTITGIGVLGLAAAGMSSVATADNKRGKEVAVQILGINDFHGNLEPPAGSSGRVGTVNAGGAEFLASHIRSLETGNPNSIVVSAGDLIGASPLLSALFHDEPTIEAMNEIGLDLNAVGNHEFDEGSSELRRMQYGGCHPTDGCLDGDGFAGADFQFLAANVVNSKSRKPLFPATSVKSFDGVKVAFIGMTLEGTPTIVSPTGISGFDFLDEADTVNSLVPKLQARGIETIVVLLHEGGLPAALDINGCNGVSGPINDIVRRMNKAVDMVVSGHTHQPYNCVIDGVPVSSAFSFGRLVTDIDLKISRKTGDVTTISVNNKIVTRDVPADPAVTSIINHYRTFAAPIANRPIGRITADITRANDDSLEQSLGNAIADAQLAATDAPAAGNAVLAFMNPGGVRADLTFAGSPVGEGDGVVTYGEAFTVQPFSNGLVTLTLTGAQIERVLEEQFCGTNSPASAGFAKVLLPSAGLRYTWDLDAPAVADCATADKVVGSSITLNGTPVDPAASYRVTVNTFLGDGGDGFLTLAAGTARIGGLVDVDAFEAYLVSTGAAGLAPPARDRIAVQP